MRKIIFAVIAISAIALSSCTTPTRQGGPKDFPNGSSQMGSNGYGQGSREQTETGSITFTGTIDGQFLDADMVPVRLCDGTIVWAKFHDDLYKVAVSANQAVAKGNIVQVVMKEADWWMFWRRFEIVSISITPKQQPAEVCRPDKEPAPTPAVRVRVPVRKTIPVVKKVQQPCCCGTNITITGNSGTITVGVGKTDSVVVPRKLPIIHDPWEEMKKVKLDNKRDSFLN